VLTNDDFEHGMVFHASKQIGEGFSHFQQVLENLNRITQSHLQLFVKREKHLILSWIKNQLKLIILQGTLPRNKEDTIAAVVDAFEKSDPYL